MSNKKWHPLAVCSNSYFSGLYITQIKLDANGDTKVQVVYYDCNFYYRPTWHKIYIDKDDNEYIRKIGQHWYLSNFMRLD